MIAVSNISDAKSGKINMIISFEEIGMNSNMDSKTNASHTGISTVL